MFSLLHSLIALYSAWNQIYAWFTLYATNFYLCMHQAKKAGSTHIQNYPFTHPTPRKERHDTAPTPAFTTGSMWNLILIRLMHDHISKWLINLSLWLNKNHTMKAYGEVKTWLHAFLPMQQICAPAATYLTPGHNHYVAGWVPEPVWTLYRIKKSIANAKNWT